MRRIFYSFHYKPDNWRVAKVRNIKRIEAQPFLADNDWEAVWRRGESAIRSWIDGQLRGKSCLVVLIGAQTASRPWVRYEIEKAWNDKKGIVGVHVHNLTDRNGLQSTKGKNPFHQFSLQDGGTMGDYAKCYDPPYLLSKNVYSHISDNLEDWCDEAFRIRNGS